jgi:serine phosphatase RsbU (regulator of sigma subunit)
VRYRPGTKGLEVGGDWYDVLDLGDGRAGVCVGDIVGRGLNAAVVMGRLRSALSALAVTGGGPARVLRGLERFVQSTDATAFATVAYAEVEPCSGRLRYGCAGHPPPLVVGPGDKAAFLEGARGTPLGTFADLPYDEAEASLPAGATLVLYTDGLVERRDEAIDRSLERLRALAAGHADESADELADTLLGAFAGSPVDDVAVLCLRVAGAG